uniref:Phosphoglycolate phosphatase n=1 Tax=Rhizophora mucronata TaxID=61149 RepID=A0A2P2M9N2_RHIMU
MFCFTKLCMISMLSICLFFFFFAMRLLHK